MFFVLAPQKLDAQTCCPLCLISPKCGCILWNANNLPFVCLQLNLPNTKEKLCWPESHVTNTLKWQFAHLYWHTKTSTTKINKSCARRANSAAMKQQQKNRSVKIVFVFWPDIEKCIEFRSHIHCHNGHFLSVGVNCSVFFFYCTWCFSSWSSRYTNHFKL